MACGDKVVDTPPFGGKEFNHITENITVCITIGLGMRENGKEIITALTLSFTVLILRSISGTCSDGAQVFRIT